MMSLLIKKDGDRVSVDHGEEVIITPSNPKKTKFNFGPASTQDWVVYTCERPGGDPASKTTKLYPSQVLPDWIDYIQKCHHVTNVIILLNDKELEVYEENGLISAYQEYGMTPYHIPYDAPDSANRIIKVLKDIYQQKNEEKVVVHCTHGMGRSGRVAALWLTQQYGLTPEMAINETLETARQDGVERMGALQQLQTWMDTLTTNTTTK